MTPDPCPPKYYYPELRNKFLRTEETEQSLQ